MRIAVTTPSGHVGSAVADFLLDFGETIQVKLLARRLEKLRGFVQRGAEIAIGSQDDPDYLVEATRDVDTLFWVTPPGYGSDNVRAFQNRLANVAARAIETNSIARVVNLSSLGADQGSGVGLIAGLHDVETILNEVTPNITHLRPGFFFENLLWQIESLRNWGRISLPLSGSVRYPMLATRDIGRKAASQLAHQGWEGRIVRELHGPSDLSFLEVADILTQALGRKIAYVPCDRPTARIGMLANGMSENAADLMLELYDAVETGRIRARELRSADTTTPTTLSEFAHERILPLISETVAY